MARQHGELATLVDLGLSDDEIAGCFDVEPVKVPQLLASTNCLTINR